MSRSGRIRLRGSRSHAHRDKSAVTIASGGYCMSTWDPWSYAMGMSISRIRTRDLKERIAFLWVEEMQSPGQPENPQLCIRKPSGFHSQTAPPPPDRLHPCQPIQPGRASSDRLLPCHQRTTKTPRSHWKSLSAKTTMVCSGSK